MTGFSFTPTLWGGGRAGGVVGGGGNEGTRRIRKTRYLKLGNKIFPEKD